MIFSISLRRICIGVLFVTFASLSISGCTRLSFHPLVSGSEVSDEEKASVSTRLKEKDEQLYTFRGIAKGKSEGGEIEGQFRQVMVFERPDKLRLEWLPIDAAYTLQLLIAKGGTATYLDTQSKKAVKGSLKHQFFESALNLPADEQTIMSLIIGFVPARFAVRDDLKIYKDATLNKIFVFTGDKSFYARLDPVSLLIEECELRNQFNGKLIVRASYSRKSLSPLPQRVVIYSRDDGSTTDFTFVNAEQNLQIPSKLFEISIPSDYEVENYEKRKG